MQLSAVSLIGEAKIGFRLATQDNRFDKTRKPENYNSCDVVCLEPLKAGSSLKPKNDSIAQYATIITAPLRQCWVLRSESHEHSAR